jgi:hypothetical protein
MLEIGVFHNGASSLPVITTKDGVTLNDGTLAEVHQAAQQTLVNQVRQGILAEKLGFQSFWLTEHHFQPEGAEMSPNPLMVQTAIAANTEEQMQMFAEEVMPVIASECGGKVELPARGLALSI